MKLRKENKIRRIKGYDYAKNGTYFVTLRTQKRIFYFGEIVNSKMELSDVGKIATKCWKQIPEHFPFVVLDEFVVMPNHVHGIIIINKKDLNCFNSQQTYVSAQNLAHLHKFVEPDFKDLKTYQNKFGSQSRNLSSIIRGYKVGVTKHARTNNLDFFWQPRFHDRIIRNENELSGIRQYIKNNPKNWELDRNNEQNSINKN
jgi:putative transposase